MFIFSAYVAYVTRVMGKQVRKSKTLAKIHNLQPTGDTLCVDIIFIIIFFCSF